MKKYGVLDAYSYPDSDYHLEKEVLEKAGYELKIGNCYTPEEIVEFAKDCDVVGDVFLPFTEEIIAQLPNLKGVVRYGIGYDVIDMEACTKRGIYACNIPTYCIEDVATHTVTLMLDLIRKVTLYDRDLRRGNWNVAYGYPTHRLSKQTIGFMGFGNIARTAYKMVKALGMDAIAYDPFLPDKVFEDMGCKRVDIDGIFKEATIISLHIPANKETTHIINKDSIDKMREGMMIVNTSRGALIDEVSLIEALKSGKLQAAAIDVVEFEPIRDKDYRLFECDNLIVTPHVAYNSMESADLLHVQVAETAVTIMNGEAPANRLNLK